MPVFGTTPLACGIGVLMWQVGRKRKARTHEADRAFTEEVVGIRSIGGASGIVE